jgi:DSF synthase
MSINVIQAVSSNNADNASTAQRDRSAQIFDSDQLTCRYAASDATLWSHWIPHGIPSFNLDLLRDLEKASRLIERRFSNAEDLPLEYIVIRSGVPGAFNVGGDLGYFQRLITRQDRAGLAEYANTAIGVIYRNYIAHNLNGATTIALLEGDALGGGFECALSCCCRPSSTRRWWPRVGLARSCTAFRTRAKTRTVNTPIASKWAWPPTTPKSARPASNFATTC